MKKRLILLILILIALLIIVECNKTEKVITLATTTSTENSGLLGVINPVFEKETGIKIKVIALGTGAAIKCAEEGNADLILVHAREKEDEFVEKGFGVNRKDVMHNDFIILGPKNDPAGIKGLNDVTQAFNKIAEKRVLFVSRGDDSGTHFKEQSLWKETSISLKEIKSEITKSGNTRTISFVRPVGDWYYSIGQGMGNTINFAFEKQGYTLADRGTYLAYKDNVDLVILVERDKKLFNPYGIIAVNPKMHSHVDYKSAMKYINWITSEKNQKIIGDFKINNEVLFFPDALK